MKSLKLSEIIKACNGKLYRGNPDMLINRFSTDTRSLKKGDFYIPVKGEKFDGHEFIKEAVMAGASGFITHAPENPSAGGRAVVKVKDTLKAFMDIASFYRGKFKLKCIGITGSCGKTTAKEMVYEVLRKKFKVLKSGGNFNNEVGTSKTIFCLNDSYDIAVIEMAMRGPGQIKELAKIVQPQIGVITNIGLSHYEFMGNLKITAKTKAELLRELPHDGVAVLNADDEFFKYFKNIYKGRIVSFGIRNKSDVHAKDINNLGLKGYTFTVEIKGKPHVFSLPVLSKLLLYNGLIAIACGLLLKVPVELIGSALKNYNRDNMRMQRVYLKGGYLIINDAYNSSPASANAALLAVRDLKISGKKYVVLGDMLELGRIKKDEHMKLGRFAGSVMPDGLFIVGELRGIIAKGAKESGLPEEKIYVSSSLSGVSSLLRSKLKKNDIVLLKASRKVGLEKIIEYLL